MQTRRIVALGLGSILFGLGAFIALRPLWGAPPLTGGSRIFDFAFAAFFMLRGAMNFRAARGPQRDS